MTATIRVLGPALRTETEQVQAGLRSGARDGEPDRPVWAVDTRLGHLLGGPVRLELTKDDQQPPGAA